ncbi:MAG: hypothetical protein ACJA2B_001736 [Candidatus Endobugula sp.]|jgi:hypothetical protein
MNYKIGNHGDKGLILLKNDLILFNRNPDSIKMHPELPGYNGVDHHIRGSFGESYPSGKFKITWQLAELSDCRRIIKRKGRLEEFPGEFISKRNCKTWKILPKIHQKIIDIDKITSSEEFKERSKFKFTFFSERINSLSLYFDFRDNDFFVHKKYSQQKQVRFFWR